MHKLWVSFCTHPNLKHIVNDFNDQEIDIRREMECLEAGCTSWCMCEMRRHSVLTQCKKECIEHFYKTPTHSDRCNKCNTVYYIDNTSSSKICKMCGTAFDILIDHPADYISRKQLNGNRRHHYTPTEHFSQTMCDFTGAGARRIPINVFAYCRAVLGRGLTVTSHNVYLALRNGGYSNYYLHKYEITNRLRGKPEFTLTSREISAMKDIYNRFRQEFIPFQRINKIGNVSKRGTMRIYWPMRYILVQLCKEINRGDLEQFIRKICGQKKLNRYDLYWAKLKDFLDSTRPSRDLVDHSITAQPLG